MIHAAMPSADTLRARASARVEALRPIVAAGAALVVLEVSGGARFVLDVPAGPGAGRERAGRALLAALLPSALAFRARRVAGLPPACEVSRAGSRAVLAVPVDRLDAVFDALRHDGIALRDATGDALAVDVAARTLPADALDATGAGSFAAVWDALLDEDLARTRLRPAEGAGADFWAPLSAGPRPPPGGPPPIALSGLGALLSAAGEPPAAVAIGAGADGAPPEGAAFGWPALDLSIAVAPAPDAVEGLAAGLSGAWLLLRLDGGEPPAAPAEGVEVASLPLAARWIPAEGGAPLEIEDLAARAEGEPALAALRADVDASKLALRAAGEGKPAADALRDRLAFAEAVSHACGPLAAAALLAGPEGTPADTAGPAPWILGGGDEVLVVGPWSRVAALAAPLRDAIAPALADVARALGGDRAARVLDVSAGVAIAPAGVPLACLAERADEELGRAKGRRRTRHGERRKAALSWGGVAVGWQDFRSALALGRALGDAIRDGHVPRGTLRRLAGVHALWRRAEEALDTGASREAAAASRRRWLWSHELGLAGAGLSAEGARLAARLSRLALEDVDEGPGDAGAAGGSDAPRRTEQHAAAWLGIVAEIAQRRSRVR